MLEEAARQTPELVRRPTRGSTGELRGAGYTAVGEFHYLGSRRRSRPPRPPRRRVSSSCSSTRRTRAAGSSASGRSRSPRTWTSSRSCAQRASASASPPTLSARVPRIGSRSSARYAAREGLPLHVHADEQPREIEECVAEHGVRPIELLAAHRLPRRRARRSSTRRTRTARELDLLADAGARVCVCPTTEANLGDGFPPVERMRDARDRALHRLGLERPHRSARRAPRARGDRATPERPPRRRSRSTSCCAIGARRARGHSASTRGPPSRSTSRTASLEGNRGRRRGRRPRVRRLGRCLRLRQAWNGCPGKAAAPRGRAIRPPGGADLAARWLSRARTGHETCRAMLRRVRGPLAAVPQGVQAPSPY